MKPLGKVPLNWSANFAYAIGLIATDGNLSKDDRHIHFTSKDLDLVLSFKRCLSLANEVGRKARGGSAEKKYYVIQFGDVKFYRFLVSIGLMQSKSKTLGALEIPNEYFADFFRGCIDGDGNINVSHHPESSRPQLRLRLCSASLEFLLWAKQNAQEYFHVQGGWIQRLTGKIVYELIYGKNDSILIFKGIYYPGVSNYLFRKHSIAKDFMGE